jgi:hypothetical protein
LVDQRQPARRAGSEHEFRTADHGCTPLSSAGFDIT